MNKLQWNFSRKSYIFIEENAFEKVVCKMAAIFSQPQCVNLQFIACDKALWDTYWLQSNQYTFATESRQMLMQFV